MQYRNADRPLDYTPLQRTPAIVPWYVRHEGAATCAVLLVAIFVCGVLGLAYGA